MRKLSVEHSPLVTQPLQTYTKVNTNIKLPLYIYRIKERCILYMIMMEIIIGDLTEALL